MEFVPSLSASGTPQPPARDWPMEVRMVCSAVEKPALYPKERRQGTRDVCRAKANLRYVDKHQKPQVAEIYLRNVSGEAVAFITAAFLRAGQTGVVELAADGSGMPQNCACRIVRFRQFREGWFEGALQYLTEPT